MKTLSILLLIQFTVFSVWAQTEFKTSQEVIKKLKTYDAEKIKSAVGEDRDKIEDNLIDDLDGAVHFANKNKVDGEFMKAVVSAASLSLKHDPSIYAAEIVGPLYKKEKKAFKEALKSLNKKDSAELEEAILDKAKEEKEGNG